MRAAAKTLAVTLCVSALALAGGGSASAQKQPSISSALKTLVKQTSTLPSRAGSAAQRRRLRSTAAQARRLAKKKPCDALKLLARYRRIVLRVKVKSGKKYRVAGQRLAALGPASMVASERLLASKATRKCGGNVKPSALPEARTTVGESTTDGMKLTVELPDLQFVPRTGGGKTWTQLVLPKTDTPAPPGTPGIPASSSTFGIPDGAEVEVQAGKTTGYSIEGVDVYPSQPDPVDQDNPPPNFFAGPFADAPFTLDKGAYKSKSLVPAAPADGFVLGTFRDLKLGSLQIPAAQWNPATKKLTVIKSVQVAVNFNGGPKQFNPEIGSPWEQAQQSIFSRLLNRNLLQSRLLEYIRRCGQEMLVITNPATLTAANQFASAKRNAGMRTTVVQTGSSPVGSTAAEIQAFIRTRLTAPLCIHPSYVTIMGDDDLVPTFTNGPGAIPSDLPYSMKDDADELPDVAVGRIIGNDNAAVANAVTKITNYTASPPTGAMLGRASIAAQFQDDNLDGQENRTFILFAETVRNGLVGRGVAVDRIYDDSPTATPLKFNDGTDLPNALKRPTFAWDGDGADVTAAWNEGRFLMIHRDHGYADGWGHPGFNTANVQALTNGALLPVLMSINCSSAAYDYDETSFVGEALVKPDGGAVGAFGDTRDSPSWHNTQIGLGFVDALLPTVLSAEGPATKQRVGNALIHGKLRLAGLSSPATDGSTRNELYLWHYFGDPSMQMWGGDGSPLTIDPATINTSFSSGGNDDSPYRVDVTVPPELNGQTVSLLRDGEVVGKAFVSEGKASIGDGFGSDDPGPGDLQVAIEADNSPPVIVPVSVPRKQTSLSQTCPADNQYGNNSPSIPITGTLSGAPAGSTVDVEIKIPASNGPPGSSRTVVAHPTTNAQGQWSTSVDPQLSEDGQWRVTSSYAGTGDLAPSSAGPCTFIVQDRS